MKTAFLFLSFFILSLSSLLAQNNNTKTDISSSSEILNSQKLYRDMHLDGVVNYNAFEQAIEGYNDLDTKNRDIVTLIDFSKPSTEERLYIFDVKQKKLLLKTYVSHGKNSGENFATSFSNENGSFKSSLGFYVTENTYQGKNGYSLILNGLEKGINDNAKKRSIVIHGASYSNPSFISTVGRLGRSLGCPALPSALSESIIDTIKDGTLLYIYANNKNYFAQSSVLSKHVGSL